MVREQGNIETGIFIGENNKPSMWNSVRQLCVIISWLLNIMMNSIVKEANAKVVI